MIKKISKVSDFDTRKDWEEAACTEIAQQLCTLSATEIRAILFTCLSRSERSLFIRRVAGLTRIIQKKSYSEIGRELWLTPQVISSLKKALISQTYVSNWARAKEQARIRQEAKFQRAERSWPKRYRRTKYGKMRVL